MTGLYNSRVKHLSVDFSDHTEFMEGEASAKIKIDTTGYKNT